MNAQTFDLPADELACRLIVHAVTSGKKPKKARAELEEMGRSLALLCGRDLPENVVRLHQLPPETQRLQCAARQALEAVSAKLHELDA